jgi:sec-independent protein translocase protein TatA
MLGTLGPFELILILAIALLLFGPTKLPGLAKGLGSAIRNFKDGMREGASDQPDVKK